MPKKDMKKAPKGSARPIRTKRDYRGAASVAKKILGQKDRESAAERRLQALIEAMEKFDQNPDDADSSDSADDIYRSPRRRWSDDSSDPE